MAFGIRKPAPPPPDNVRPFRDTLAAVGPALDDPITTKTVKIAPDIEWARRLQTSELAQEIRDTMNLRVEQQTDLATTETYLEELQAEFVARVHDLGIKAEVVKQK